MNTPITADLQNLSLELEQERRNVSFDTYDYGRVAHPTMGAPFTHSAIEWDQHKASEFSIQ